MEHWREAVDQATSRVYYYNRKTRETSWVPPLGYEPHQSSTKVASQRKRRGYFSVSDVREKRKSESPCSPSSIRESGECEQHPTVDEEREIKTAVDSTTGRTYYYDRKTRETFWEDPRKENSDSLVERLLQRVRTNLRGSPAKRKSKDDDISEEGESDYCADEAITENKGDSEASAGCEIESSPSIDDVRASLKLLKTRLKSRSSDASSLEVKHVPLPERIPSKPPPAQRPSPRQRRRSWFRSSSKETVQECKRQSGCTCPACVNQAPVELDLIQCSVCERSFHPESYEKHKKACTGKPRKVSARQIPKASVTAKPTKSTSWREQSEQLRAAVKRDGDGEGYKETLVPCPHCGRSFNEKAAQRHIPICTKIKAKPKMLRRRSGVGAFKNHKKSLEASNSSGSPRGQHKSTTRTKDSAKRVSVSESGVSRSRCPHCSRQFSAKAFERHLDFCRTLKEKNSLERKSGAPRHRKEASELPQHIPSLENNDFIGIDEAGQYYYKFQFDE